MPILEASAAAKFRAALPPLPAQRDAVPWPTATWTTADPSPDVDGAGLQDALDHAFADPQPTEEMGVSLACVVVHHGEIIAERYGPDTTADTTLISWSMAKSITHAAVGILVAEGRMNLDEPVSVPEWRAPGDPRSAITLRHLLHMTSGLEFNEDYVDDATSHCLEMLFGEGTEDMGAFAAGQDLIHPVGEVFNYSSGTTNIIARLVRDQLGEGGSTSRWLKERLFAPLGMTSAEAKLDGSGTFVGSSYVYATARDFARFGLLYLRDGVWDGERILPPGWVDFARSPVAVDPESGAYGAHWWVPYPDRGIFSAQGYETQRITVVPTADAIIVRLGKTPITLAPNVLEWQNTLIGCLDSV